jgi:dTDP-4-amino-4,6-dideoxygalactose transaminase
MIRMNDFAARPLPLREAEKAAAARVLDSGHYILGAEVRAFEARWAAACGTRHAAGVGNGMDAIEIALRALDIGPGDEVVTSAMTAAATVLAIVRAGATPVLGDIDPRTALLDLASLERCLSPRTRAVLPVHLYGQVRGMADFQALARARGLHLVEDCAQAHLARADGRCAGSFGAIGAYSFYPTKNLGAVGDAGAVVTDDDALAQAVLALRDYGQAGKYRHVRVGLNSRLDEMQAAILSARLDWLEAATGRRRAIAAAYRARLANPQVRLLAAPETEASHVHHLFVVTCARRDALAQHLAGRGIESAVHYPLALHRQPAFADIAVDPAGLAHAERHAQECLSLPCHPAMDDDAVAAVCEAVDAFA